jgi:transcriptional regulator with XRE-family HTH domain
MEVEDMKLGDVLRKERERKRFTVEYAATYLGLPAETFEEMEGGESLTEEWGPKLAEIAIKLSTPTSRLISETGKSAEAKQRPGQCGELIKAHREKKGLSREDFAEQLNWPVEQVELIEKGESPLETYAPVLLRFAEMINQPIFNLFYPCGLPFSELTDY